MLPCATPRWRHALAALLRSVVALLLRVLGALTGGSPPSPPPQLCATPLPRAEPPVDAREAAFIAHAGDAYGYRGRLGALRAAEFSRLRGGGAYVDHAGAALYSETQLADLAAALSRVVLANPHSGSDASRAADVALDAARRATLAWCRAPPGAYVVVFTANATAALKLVAEAFPWAPGSCFWYALESHSSVVGMREYALRAGAAAAAVTIDSDAAEAAASAEPRWRLTPRGDEMRRECSRDGSSSCSADAAADTSAPASLFALPAECNFSGARLDLRLVAALQGGGAGAPPGRWAVLLDAAKAAATHPPDLSVVRPHFVALSYYKIFGYPTGLGALLVRADALPLLAARAYWGGGAFEAAAADADFVARRQGAPGLHDGTAAFTAAAAVPRGFACLERLGGAAAADAHALSLAAHVAASLRALRHGNGATAAVVYGWGARVASGAVVGQGPTVAFNMLVPTSGAVVPHAAVEQALALRCVSLRGGCFCNPGACAAALGLSAADVRAAHADGHACGDVGEKAPESRRGGAARGALRASFGYSSAFSDAAALLDALTEFFVTPAAPGAAPQPAAADVAVDAAAPPSPPPRVQALAVYPLKSAAPFVPDGAWPLGPNGLLFDRHWAAADASGAALTLARAPRLARIAPRLDLRAGTMTLTLRPGDDADDDVAAAAGAAAEPPLPPLVLPLWAEEKDANTDAGVAMVRVCGTRRACARPAATAAAAAADTWLSAALRAPCRLVRCGAGGCSRAFANDDAAALLLVTASSVAALEASVARRAAAERRPPPPPVRACRFRPNVVLAGTLPYEEDMWRALATAGGATLRVAGACARCAMVCADPATGRRTGAEPLLTLTAERMRDGRPRFGVLLAAPEGQQHQASAPLAADGDDADDVAWMTRRWRCVLRVGDTLTPLT